MKLYEQNCYKGGVKASRNNPKCYSKQDQKETWIEKIQSANKLSFVRKHLSLEPSYTSFGISENLINLLKILTSGDITTLTGNTSSRPRLMSCMFSRDLLLIYVSEEQQLFKEGGCLFSR